MIRPASARPDPANGGVPDLSREEVRAALTDTAVEAFVNLAEIWRLSGGQAAALLGETDEKTWFAMRGGGRTAALSENALTRISALVGLYKGLHLLFSEPLVDDWVRRPNTETLFGGRSPLDMMMAGGLPAMLAARAYVDALRGGL